MDVCRIYFTTTQPLLIPVAYNYGVQGMLYHILDQVDPEYSAYLHDTKWMFHNRTYSPYTFSRIHGYYQYKNKMCQFFGIMQMEIRSIDADLLERWAYGFENINEILLYDQKINVEDVVLEEWMFTEQETYDVKMETPVVVHVNESDQPSGYRFLSPIKDKALFSENVARNAERKWNAFFPEYCNLFAGQTSFTPVLVGEKQKCITFFKNTSLCGWRGRYRIAAPAELMKVLYLTGIGERNGQGFGMFDLVSEEKNRYGL